MGSSDLLMICISAFISVFVLLSILAAFMYLVTVIFPRKATKIDAAVMAAVATVVSSLYPGTRVTKIEELK